MNAEKKRGRGISVRTEQLIASAINILTEIQPASVRAVCYRLFVLGEIASMSKNETNRVSRILTRAREAGLVPWEWIVDETRQVECLPAWNDPHDFLASARRWYRRDHWHYQPTHLEVWSEKGTIRGTIQPVLDEFGVPFRVMHGYGSATALNSIAEEAARSIKPWVILYVGDFDPSGLHMSVVDIPSRLASYGSGYIAIRRVALTESDVVAGDLPYFPLDSKRHDPRHAWYMEHTRGIARGRCWELDALSPVRLRERLKAHILTQLDRELWQRSVLAEEAEQVSMRTCFDSMATILGQASQ